MAQSHSQVQRELNNLKFNWQTSYKQNFSGPKLESILFSFFNTNLANRAECAFRKCTGSIQPEGAKRQLRLEGWDESQDLTWQTPSLNKGSPVADSSSLQHELQDRRVQKAVQRTPQAECRTPGC